MEYNIGFVIGDPSGDGHACTTEYHIVANHSVDEISEAYKKTTELLGFDFVKEVGVEFQSDPWIPEKFTKKLLELEIIDKEYVIESDSEYGTPAGCYEFECAEDIKVKQNEIASIQTQIEFNQQVADDNSKYISKLKDLIS